MTTFDPAAVRAYAEAMLTLIGPDPLAHLHVADLKADQGWTCSIYRCERPHRALGMCDLHLQRHKRAVAQEAFTVNRKAKAATRGQAA